MRSTRCGSPNLAWLAQGAASEWLLRVQAVLRPGRIDKLVEVPLPTAADKVDILRLATSAMALAEDV